jgi:Ion channel
MKGGGQICPPHFYVKGPAMGKKSRIKQSRMSSPVKEEKQKEHRYLVSLIIMIVTLLFYPMLSYTSEGHNILALLFALMLFSMIRAVCIHAWEIYLGYFLIACGFGLSVWSRFVGEETGLTLRFFSNLSFILFIGYVIVATLKFLFYRGKITVNILYGAVSVYFLIGFIWALIYMEILMVNNQAILFAGKVHTIEQAWGEMLYYSFVTLTTTGYGDITPVSSLARSVTVLEAMAGVLYTTILIGRFAGMVTISNKNDKEPVE